MPVDERAEYVKSVCDVLIESRFGPGRPSQLVVQLSDRPELEPAVFYDLLDDEMVPCYEIFPDGRYHYQVAEAAFRKEKERRLAAERAHANAASRKTPSSLARGSPAVAEPGTK